MRRWIALGFALIGCQFERGTAASPDGAGGAGTGVEPLPCTIKRTWAADFSIDPTTINANGDTVPDWRIRESGAFPGQLTDGVWALAGTPTVALDTQPKDNFNRRVRAIARLRNTSAGGTRGAVLALNVDYSPMTYMPLYLEVRLEPGEQAQTATLHGSDAGGDIVLATFAELGTGMVDVVVDVDPAKNSVTVQVGSESSTHGYTPIPRNMNDDRFASLATYDSATEFDAVRIELCM